MGRPPAAMCTGLEEADVAFDRQITEPARWESQQKALKEELVGACLPVDTAGGQPPGVGLVGCRRTPADRKSVV